MGACETPGAETSYWPKINRDKTYLLKACEDKKETWILETNMRQTCFDKD